MGKDRVEKTLKVLNRTDVAVIICDYNGIDDFEKDLIEKFNELKTPYIIVINKSDEEKINFEKIGEIKNYTYDFIETSANYDVNLATIFKNLLFLNFRFFRTHKWTFIRKYFWKSILEL